MERVSPVGHYNFYLDRRQNGNGEGRSRLKIFFGVFTLDQKSDQVGDFTNGGIPPPWVVWKIRAKMKESLCYGKVTRIVKKEVFLL